MRVFLCSLISLYLLTNCKANKTVIVKNKKLTTQIDSISYALGMQRAIFLKSYLGKDFNKKLFLQGFIDVVDSTDLLITKKDLRRLEKTTRAFFKEKSKERKKNQQKQISVEFKEHKKENEQFLIENKTKQGVKTTPSGLQYIVLKEGTGKSPKITSAVKVHYKGINIKGEEFDSSYKRKKPSEFDVNRVIKGWEEGLLLMREGGKYKLFIPQNLAYKNKHQGKYIKPYSTLIFEIELLSVK